MNMDHVVSITTQGQLTIPKSIRKAFKMTRSMKATIEKQGNVIILRPKNDFWTLAGSLKSSVKLSDKQLREARQKFSESWGK